MEMTQAPVPLSLLNPAARSYRFVILALAGLISFGSYFAYDSVGAIENALMREMGASRGDIGFMYTAYSVAAIVSVLVGGVLVDRIGTRRGSLLFSLLIVGGAAIVALAPGLSWIYIGRLLFGCGSESLVVAQNSILARWFRGRELAFSFGVSLALSRLGTILSFNTEALIAERAGFRMALWAAVALCVVSLICNLIYNRMDRRAEGAPGLALAQEGAGEHITLSDLRRFPLSYYYVVGLCLAFYSAIFPFTALSTDFFHEKWGLPLSAGGEGFWGAVLGNFRHMFSTAPGTSSIIMTASLVFAPLAGGLVDWVGRRAWLMLLGSLLLIPCFLVLAFTHVPPVGPMVVLGTAFVLIPAAMWPMVPLLVEKERVGTAYGLMTMVQNLGLALFPWLNGKLRDATHDYTASMLMFASLGVVGLVFALLLWRADRKR
jgi:MFS family permease